MNQIYFWRTGNCVKPFNAANEERYNLASMEKLKLLDRNRMRLVSFSPYSDMYLDSEEETKHLIVEHLQNSTNPFVSIDLSFRVEKCDPDRG